MKDPFIDHLKRLGYSWRTIRRHMARGGIPGAYRTKGGHWRIRRPRGAKDEDVKRWLVERIGGTNYNHSPSLMRWIDGTWAAIERYEIDHPVGRNALARRPAAELRPSDEFGEGPRTID
jgi:hypothetical protein